MSHEVLERLVEEVVALRRRVAELETQERQRMIGARVYRTTNQTIPTGIGTLVSFDAERWDTDNCWSSAQPTRLVCNTPGWYMITCNIAWAANATNQRMISISLNGTIRIARDTRGANPNGLTVQSVATIWPLTTGDYLEVLVFQDSGGNLDLYSSTANEGANNRWSPEFMMVRL